MRKESEKSFLYNEDTLEKERLMAKWYCQWTCHTQAGGKNSPCAGHYIDEGPVLFMDIETMHDG